MVNVDEYTQTIPYMEHMGMKKGPSYIGIIINHYKDPYQTTSIMERAHLGTSTTWGNISRFKKEMMEPGLSKIVNHERMESSLESPAFG